MIRGSIHQEGIVIINIYTPNNRAPKDINKALRELKREMDSFTIIGGDSYAPL